MTATPEPAGAVCCGEGGPETPAVGEPQVVACQLCPRAGSGRYWRDARADGQPYEPVKPLDQRH